MGRRTERKSLPGAVFFFLLLLFFCSSRIVLDSKARIEGGVCIPRGTMRTKGDEQEEIQRFCNNLFRRFFPLIYCIFRSVSFFFFFLYEIPRRVHERVRTNVIRRHEIKSVSNRRTKRKRGRERERERREGIGETGNFHSPNDCHTPNTCRMQPEGDLRFLDYIYIYIYPDRLVESSINEGKREREKKEKKKVRDRTIHVNRF